MINVPLLTNGQEPADHEKNLNSHAVGTVGNGPRRATEDRTVIGSCRQHYSSISVAFHRSVFCNQAEVATPTTVAGGAFQTVQKAETRARKIEQFIGMLEREEKIHSAS